MRVTTVDDRCRLFFRLVFDDFEFSDFSDDRCTKSLFGKKSRARCFGKAFWAVQGGSGRAFWAVQGGPGGHLGGSWGPLGAVLGGLGAILERLFEQSDFGSIF